MGFKKHKEKVNHGKVEFISFISFLLGFSNALLIYMMSSFFKLSLVDGIEKIKLIFPNFSFLNVTTDSDNVGIFYFVAHILVLINLFKMHRWIKKLGKANVFFVALLVQIISLVLLIFTGPSWIGSVIMIVQIIAIDVVWVSLDIILEGFSEDKSSGRIRGLHLMITNAGFLLGPFLSSRIIGDFGFESLFLIAAMINMLIFVFAMIFLRSANDRFEERLTMRDIFDKVLVNKDIVNIYGISFVLEFFYALMVVYVPIYLLDFGFTWGQLGGIFTIMLLPFVIFEYPLGILADKKTGEKELIIAGVVMLGVSSFGVYFTQSASVLVWGMILFATRIGASFVEILRDSYFYKKIDGRDADVISFFRTARPLAYILSAAISASAFKFLHLPVKFAFLLVGFVCLLALFPALRMVDNKCEKDFC